MSNLQRGILELRSKIMKPNPRLNLVEWADTYRYLSPESSSTPGKWSTDLVEAARGPMLAVTEPGVKKITVMGPTQLLKALALDTPIPTPNGWTTMGEIKVGDQVFGEKGDIFHVTGVSEVKHSHQCFKVTFSDGASVVADAGHLWTLKEENSPGVQIEKTVTTLQISKNFKNGNRNRYVIPLAEPLKLDEKDLPIDPYLFGVWLGDGSTYHGQLSLNLQDSSYILSYIDEKYEIREDSENCINVKIDGFFKRLRLLGLLENKHIPSNYLRGSFKQRLSLLQGIMDTDGTINSDGRACVTIKSDKMANDVSELLYSLGLKGKIGKVSVKYDNKILIYNMISFTAYNDLPIFRLPRKLERMSSTEGRRVSETKRRRIIDVQEVESVPVKCIMVDNPTHLYLCGREFVPTHNTEFINNVVGYFMSQDPAPIIVMQPIEKLADTWAMDRLEPMIRDTPILRGLVKDKRERDSGNMKLHKSFPGGHVTVVSAGSPSDVASRPVRVVLMDEIDKYKTSGNEGNPEKLIEQRTETFWNALSIAVCSPTLDGSSNIANRFEDSDQRYFHGRCPYCENLEKLVWEQVKWVDKDPSTAHYECSHCGENWSELDRLKAIAPGRAEYVATKPFNGHAGFTCNAIASPWQPLSKMVEKFLEAKGDPEKLKVFVNTSLAETWKPAVDMPDYERLYERRELYAMERVPTEEIKFLTMGVDVQADRLEAQVVGWTRDKQSYSIAYKAIPGFTHTDVPWAELRTLIQSTFEVEGTSREMPISFVCIDSGFNTSKVHEFVQGFSPNKVRAIKGSDSLQAYYKMGSDITQNFDGSKNKFAHKTWVVGSSFAKTDLYNNIKLPMDDGEGNFPANYCHFPQYDMEFFKGLCSESLILEKGKYEWKKHFTRNEPLDTWIYARVGASMFGLDRFKPQDWDALEGIMEMATKAKTMPQAPIENKPRPAPARSSAGTNIWKNANLKRRF